jgi:hypothetical protein
VKIIQAISMLESEVDVKRDEEDLIMNYFATP